MLRHWNLLKPVQEEQNQEENSSHPLDDLSDAKAGVFGTPANQTCRQAGYQQEGANPIFGYNVNLLSLFDLEWTPIDNDDRDESELLPSNHISPRESQQFSHDVNW